MTGQLHDPASRAVDKITVVGDKEHCAVVGIEGVFQDLAGDDVQMVGRLIEDKEISLRKHELGQGYPAPFAAREFSDQFEHIVSCKEEGGKEIADLGVGHGGEGIGDLFKDRIAVVEDLLLLIIITDMDIGTQADVAGVLPQDPVQDLENGCLAGAVIPDQGYMLSPADMEPQSGKQLMAAEGFTEPLHSQDFTAAADAGSELQMHVIAQNERLFDDFHFVEHLFPAFGAFDGFFAVKLTELRDDLFLMADLGLIVQPGAALLVTERLFFLRVSRIITGKKGGGGIFDLDDLCDRPVQEIAVMGDDEDSAAVIGEVGLQPADAAKVQMVGRLIEHDHVRLSEKEPGESHPGLLAAGESGDLFVKLIIPESQASEDSDDFSLVGIAVHHLKPVEQAGIGLDQFTQGVSFDTFHLALIPGELFLHFNDLSFGFKRLFINCVRSIQSLILGEIAQLSS